MSKFTPGPWRAGRKHPDWPHCKVQYVIAECTNDEVCTLYYNDDEQDANARLIAAAPEMYELLHRLAPVLADEGLSAMSLHIFDLLDKVEEKR